MSFIDGTGEMEPPRRIQIGDLVILEDTFSVTVRGGPPLPLTKSEYRLLMLLAAANGQPVSIDKLADLLTQDLSDKARAVRGIVYLLRKKLGSTGQQIHNVPGVGYLLSEQSE